MFWPVKLVAHALSCASTVKPKPGPAIPPPLKPRGLGESGLPLGANLVRPPVHEASRFCAPTVKLSATQTFPSLSIISLPPPLQPPPVNLSGKIQALGAKVR